MKTWQEIKETGKPFLTCEDVAEFLGCHPQNLRLTIRDYPERVGFHYTMIGKTIHIPTPAFRAWYTGAAETGGAT